MVFMCIMFVTLVSFISSLWDQNSSALFKMLSDAQILSDCSDEDNAPIGYVDHFAASQIVIGSPSAGPSLDVPLPAIVDEPILQTPLRPLALDTSFAAVLDLDTPDRVSPPRAHSSGMTACGLSPVQCSDISRKDVDDIQIGIAIGQEESIVSFDHPEERPRKLYDADSMKYFTDVHTDYFFAAKLERGNQKRPWR